MTTAPPTAELSVPRAPPGSTATLTSQPRHRDRLRRAGVVGHEPHHGNAMIATARGATQRQHPGHPTIISTRKADCGV